MVVAFSVKINGSIKQTLIMKIIDIMNGHIITNVAVGFDQLHKYC